MTAALTGFITEYMGERFMVQEPFDLEDTFLDLRSQTPLFFVLFPGVDPGEEIEALGKKLGFTRRPATTSRSRWAGPGEER